MTFININNHIASINNNLSICDSAKCNKMIDILNKDILPFITYNSNLVYGFEYSSNVLHNDYYGWYDIPSTNSNMILIPNIIYNTIDISSNQYSSEFINLPSYNDFILPDIYAPILNTHTDNSIEIIKKLIFSFNNFLLPISYIPEKPYFEVTPSNDIILHSDDSENELILQKTVINILQEIRTTIWNNINLQGFYTFDLPKTINIPYDITVQYISKVLIEYFDKLNSI